jgi:hypothetical protein
LFNRQIFERLGDLEQKGALRLTLEVACSPPAVGGFYDQDMIGHVRAFTTKP